MHLATVLANIKDQANIIRINNKDHISQELTSQELVVVCLQLEENTSVTHLVMDDIHIDNNAAEALAGMLRKNNTLKDIALNNFSGDLQSIKTLIQGLHANKSIESLSIMQGISITSIISPKPVQENISKEWAEGLAAIVHSNSTLKQLNLVGIKASAESFQILAGGLANSKLESLIISATDLSEARFQSLCTALKHHPTITSISLYDNNLDDKAIITLADAIKTFNNLAALHLRDDQLHGEGLYHLAGALSNAKQLHALSLCDHKLQISNGGSLMFILENCTVLTKLLLDDTHLQLNENSTFLEKVGKHKTLAHLNLSESSIDKAGMLKLLRAIKSNQNLQTVYLENVKLCGFDLATILPQIEEALYEHRSLEEFSLADTRYDEESLDQVADEIYERFYQVVDEIDTILEENAQLRERAEIQAAQTNETAGSTATAAPSLLSAASQAVGFNGNRRLSQSDDQHDESDRNSDDAGASAGPRQ